MKLVEEDGLNYLSTVRAELNDRMSYMEFLLIMKEFRLQRVGIKALTMRIKELFRGNVNLIVGVNKFLPKGHKIEIDLTPKKPVEIKDALQFIEKIKMMRNSMRKVKSHQKIGIEEERGGWDHPGAVELGHKRGRRIGKHPEAVDLIHKRRENLPNGGYREFLDILNLYRQGKKSASEFYQEVVMVFKEHHELLEGFRHFLPCSTMMTPLQQAASQGNSSEHISTQVEKVERNATYQEDHEMNIVEQLHEHKLVDKTLEMHPSLASSDDNSALRKSLRMEEPSTIQKCNKRKRFATVDSIACESYAAHQDSLFSNEEEDKHEHPNHQYNPSYRFIRKNHETPPLKQQRYEDTVLNHDLVIKRSTEDYSSKQRRKSQCEELLFQCEDDKFEMDMLIERTKATSRCIKELLAKIHDKTFQSDSQLNIKDHMSVIQLRCIEQMYGDYGQDMVDLLQKTPSRVLPVILLRFQQKKREFKRLRSSFDEQLAATIMRP